MNSKPGSITMGRKYWALDVPFYAEENGVRRALTNQERKAIELKVKAAFPRGFKAQFRTELPARLFAAKIKKATGVELTAIEATPIYF
jgi:hypothetical protein